MKVNSAVTTLGRKQGIPDQQQWLEIRRRARELVPDIERSKEDTVGAIRTAAGGRGLAFGWSGGKDSIILERLCTPAGFPSCILVITALEFRAFLQWVDGSHAGTTNGHPNSP